MEVLWKTAVVVLNLCIGKAITFHDVIHILRTSRGMGTTSIKANLIQNLVAIREEVLYEIFLNIHNTYDALDIYRCLGIFI